MAFDALKELAKTLGMVLNVEFVDELAVGQSDSHAVTRAADAYRLWVHMWLLTRWCDEEIHPHVASTFRATISRLAPSRQA